MLLNHRADKIMGKWDNVRIEGTQLLADAIFDETDEEATKMLSKVEQGMLNCTSIGFEIEEVQYGMPGFEDTPIVIECSLKEASLTPIPSNEGAIRLYDKEGTLLTSDKVLTILNKVNINQPNMKKIEFFAAALSAANITLPTASTEDDLLKVVQKLSSDHAETLTKLQSAIDDKKALNDKLTALETSVKDGEKLKVDELVDGAVKAGKLTADKADQYKTLAKADFITTKSIIDGLPVRTSLSKLIENGNGAQGTGINKYEGWGLKRLHKDAPKELARIKAEEPECYKQLIADNE